ncbi:glycosyltransferase family A protein [Amnibacterium soli]|jgi:glycosyltransferase involved in cell wall biosynthesis|uniref:Glycosyltransferase family A protein n=1 Tax=Amnibacterium soli TaxID=1282736 RepID=A0ABP8ZAS0_9MICO
MAAAGGARALTVSVVIPVRNDAEPLARCFRALAAQTVPPDEVVVVDNGSTDDSAAVAGRAGARVVVEHEQGIGAAASRGYDAATGDLILRLDTDSVPPPMWIARIVQAFEADAGLGALSGPGAFLGMPRPLGRLATAGYMGIYFTVLGAIIGRAPLFGSNLAMRRAAWQAVSAEVHRHDTGVHDDLDLSLHLAPRFPTRLDRSLVVRMSARPLASASGMLERLQRAVHTMRLHADDVRMLRRGSAATVTRLVRPE